METDAGLGRGADEFNTNAASRLYASFPAVCMGWETDILSRTKGKKLFSITRGEMPTENWINKPHIGDCREIMRSMVADGVKVQCAITSPPYWGLRDYGVEGQLGMEETPEAYVQNMVEVFSLVNELLTDDGTLWLNLGDTYSAHKDCKSVGQSLAKGTSREDAHVIPLGQSHSRNSKMLKQQGYKPKDLVGIPWRTAFALQAQGWYLRSDIIWAKPNSMPESVKDRPTKSHEYIFLLSKNQKYYYDAEAIAEDFHSEPQPPRDRRNEAYGAAYLTPLGAGLRNGYENGKRNKRSVWTIPTQPYREAHFATFPPALITPCILAGSRVGDTVLDPFFGSGTTGEVAEKLGRKWIGIDLNPKYEALQKKRTAQTGLVWGK